MVLHKILGSYPNNKIICYKYHSFETYHVVLTIEFDVNQLSMKYQFKEENPIMYSYEYHDYKIIEMYAKLIIILQFKDDTFTFFTIQLYNASGCEETHYYNGPLIQYFNCSSSIPLRDINLIPTQNTPVNIINWKMNNPNHLTTLRDKYKKKHNYCNVQNHNNAKFYGLLQIKLSNNIVLILRDFFYLLVDITNDDQTYCKNIYYILLLSEPEYIRYILTKHLCYESRHYNSSNYDSFNCVLEWYGNIFCNFLEDEVEQESVDTDALNLIQCYNCDVKECYKFDYGRAVVTELKQCAGNYTKPAKK